MKGFDKVTIACIVIQLGCCIFAAYCCGYMEGMMKGYSMTRGVTKCS